jgi:hypothetical protein
MTGSYIKSVAGRGLCAAFVLEFRRYTLQLGKRIIRNNVLDAYEAVGKVLLALALSQNSGRL